MFHSVSRSFLLVWLVRVIVTLSCHTVCGSSSDAPGVDHVIWSSGVDQLNTTGVKAISVDMDTLSPTSNTSLEFDGNPKTYVLLRIQTPDLDRIEPCTIRANKLMLFLYSVNKSAPLVCGNEIAALHAVKFPFRLTFIKGSSDVTRPQLNKFDITLEERNGLPSDFYSDFVITPQPRILYTPLYPDEYSGIINLDTFPSRSMILFQVRYRKVLEDSYCENQYKEIKEDPERGYECQKYLVTLVRDSFWHADEFHFVKSTSVIEYRSVREDYLKCKNDHTYIVEGAVYFSIDIKRHCNVTFKAKNPSQVLVFTSLSKDGCEDSCDDGNLYIQTFIGNKRLHAGRPVLGFFGYIRSPPGQNVRMDLHPQSDRWTDVGSGAYVNIVVEAYDVDALPDTVNAHQRHSYMWMPGTQISTAPPPIHAVRSIPEQCVEFLVRNQDMQNIEKPLADSVTLYSGYGTSGNFKLTEDCLGRPTTDRILKKGRNGMTTIVTESREPFWFIISGVFGLTGKLEFPDEPCQATPIHLNISARDVLYSIFNGLPISKNMDCLFAIQPRTAYINADPCEEEPPNDIKFRGRLSEVQGAELYAIEEGWPADSLADFRRYRDEMSKWYYYNRYTALYLYFRTQEEVQNGLVSFEYGSRYKCTDKVETHPGCPERLVVTLDQPGAHYFQTPDYPNHLEQNLVCSWRFKRPANRTNEFIHVTVDVNTIPCWPVPSTKLSIKNGTNGDVQVLCQDRPTDPIYSQVFPGDVDLVLWGGNNHLVGGIRFHVHFSEIASEQFCGKTYIMTRESESVKINATLVRGQYFSPLECQIKFESLDSAVHLRAIYNNEIPAVRSHVHFYDGTNTTGRVMRYPHYTNKTEVTSGRHLLVDINPPDHFNPVIPLMLTVVVVEDYVLNWAGKTNDVFAYEKSQYLTSAEYPGGYGPVGSVELLWAIRSWTGDEVEIKIEELTLESDAKCALDSLVIYDGSDINSPVLARICGSIKRKLTFRSSSKALFLRFKPQSYDGPPFPEGKFKVEYFTRQTPSAGLEKGDGRYYTGHEENNSGGTIGVNTIHCLLVALCSVLIYATLLGIN